LTPTLRVERVRFDDPDAVALREAMVTEVSAMYAGQRDTGTNGVPTAVDAATVLVTLVGYVDDRAAAHAVLRRLGDEVEIKRMFVSPDARGTGAADALMAGLEAAARESGASRVILHTGDRQLAAIRTYERHGYTPIPVYEPYVGMSESLCFEKVLDPQDTDR
jgi:GNAT superfamily N-acetyltransferase